MNDEMNGHVNAQVVSTNPEQGQRWIEASTCPIQRHLRAGHKEFVARQMSKHQFPDGTSIHFAVLPDKTEWLIDGNHRLHALVESEQEIKFTVVSHYVSSEEEARYLYTTFDRQMTRTPADAIAAIQPQELEGWTKPEINKFVGALKVLYQGFISTRPGKMGMSEIILGAKDWSMYGRAYLDTTQKLAGESQKIVSGKLLKAPIFAIGLATYRFAELSHPEDFWSQVARDDRLAADDPRKLLHSRLLRLDEPRGTGRLTRQEVVVGFTTYAWNMYASNQTGSRLRTYRKREAILQTPFDYSVKSTEYRDMYEDCYQGLVMEEK